MRNQPTKSQLRLYGAIAIGSAVLIILAMLVERWVVFLPYSSTIYLKWMVFGTCMIGLSLLCVWRIKHGYRTTAYGYISLPFAVLLFSWIFMEAVYGFIAASNSTFLGAVQPLCLNVVSNMNAPEGIFSRTYSINVTVKGEALGATKVIRYRYPEINFRYLVPGDSVQVLARPGWAGYSLEKTVSKNKCN